MATFRQKKKSLVNVVFESAIVFQMWKPTQFFLVYPGDALQRGKTPPAFSPMIHGEILFQKINCGFFAARNVLSFPPKIPWRAGVNFIPKNQTAVFSSHAKFSARRGCTSFHREPVEILFQKINCGFFASRKVSARRKCPRFHGEPVEIQTSQPHHVHVQWRGCICIYH